MAFVPLDGWGHGDVHQRIDRLSKQISKKADINLLLKRALLLRDDGNQYRAWSDYKQVLKLDPVNPDALYLGAMSALELGLTDNAQVLADRFFTQVKDLHRKAAHARAYQLFSDIFLAKNEGAKALSFFKKSMKLQTQPSPDRWLALADLHLQYEGYTAALATLKQAISQSGGNAIVQQKIIETAITHKDFKTAIIYLNRQLNQSASLRKIILLIRKSEVLSLMGDSEQSNSIKQYAKQLFFQLPENKKMHSSSKLIQQKLYKLN